MARTTHIPYLDDPDEGLSPSTSHPAYVASAPDWFWSEDDPRAPFGSDSGHDMLSALEDHFRRGGGDAHVPGCVATVITDGDLVPERIWDSSAEEIGAWLAADESHRGFLHSEIALYVAAACGQFKISGWIHPALRFWAERALMLLEHVLLPWEHATLGVPEDRYDARLTAIRSVIDAAPEPPKRLQLRMYRGR